MSNLGQEAAKNSAKDCPTNQKAVVQRGCRVVMDFVVRLVSGKVVDSSEKSGGPASFVCGKGDFPKPVEEGIIGLSPGEVKTITVHPFYAYGLYDPKKQMLVAMERIPQPVEQGKVVKVPDQLGITRPAVVRDIWPGAIMVDFNHPLAGQALKFEVVIREVIREEDGLENEKEQ